MHADYQQLQTRLLAWMDSPSAADDFDAVALEVHAFQHRWNTPYRNYSDAVLAGRQPATAAGVPAVPGDAFKNHTVLPAIASPDDAAATFHTSGTTGESRGVHPFVDTSLYAAATRLAWRHLDLPRARPLFLSQRPSDAPHSSLTFMFGLLAEGRDDAFFVASEGTLQLDRLRESISNATAPVLLAGTALAFLHLFEKLDAPLRLPPGSTALETGGYKGTGRSLTKRELYAQFTRHLGLPPGDVINEYGMTELTSQFYARGLGAPHRAPHWLRATVVDPATGQQVADGATGLLHIHDLANLGSVAKLATRDLAVRRGPAFELLGRNPAALPRGCSRQADELLSNAPRP